MGATYSDRQERANVGMAVMEFAQSMYLAGMICVIGKWQQEGAYFAIAQNGTHVRRMQQR